MFENIGWFEVLVVIVAGLFIIGPERLPAAIAWVGRTLRKARDFATGARQQLKDEMGSDFDELRKPLEDLRSLRAMGPRKAITHHLLDDYDPTEDLRQYDMRDEFDDAKLPPGGPFSPTPSTPSPPSTVSNGSSHGPVTTNGFGAEAAPSEGNTGTKPVGRPAEPGNPTGSQSAAQPAPFDSDAT